MKPGNLSRDFFVIRCQFPRDEKHNRFLSSVCDLRVSGVYFLNMPD